MERLSKAGAARQVGGFRYFRTKDDWRWSDNVAAIHNYQPGKTIPAKIPLSQKHPDDRHYVAQTLDAIHTSTTTTPESSFVDERRVLPSDTRHLADESGRCVS
ncbi:hypothetical protein BKP42_58060 [Rhodococcus erythropolis]|nr:hypothetical protein BKP42_58060 [Rhodococcus erythropolis]